MSAAPRCDVVIVGGLGHVGLPLGIVLADTGLQVGLYDLDHSRRALVEQGRMPFIEYDAEPILQRVIGRQLHVLDDMDAVHESEYVIVTIGTPLDEYLNPKTSLVLSLAEQLCAFVRPGHQIVLRSTVFPGTTQRLAEFFMGRGVRVNLSFCPERIVQGQAIRELPRLPQIISGCSDEAVRYADALFRRLNIPTITLGVHEAELTKLFSNAWRYIQFATANQFYMIAQQSGADFYKIYGAMTAGYERMANFPRPGFAAGPCLLKDTMQLAALLRGSFQLGYASMLINEGLPSFLVERIAREYPLAGATVGILGMAFKADIDDIRDSLSYKLRKQLAFAGATVLCSDEYAQDPTFIAKDALIERAQIIIIGAPHSQYRGLAFPPSKPVIDVWGLTQQEKSVAHV